MSPGAVRRIAALLLLAAGPVLVLGVLFVLPVTGMVAEGFVADGRFAPGAVLDVLARPRVHRVAWFTVWSSGVATVLAVVLGLPAAYALSRMPGYISAVLLVLALIFRALPRFSVVLPMYDISRALGIYDTTYALAIALVVLPALGRRWFHGAAVAAVIGGSGPALVEVVTQD